MTAAMVIAVYQPHEGKEQELLELVRAHVPTLQRLELATDDPPMLGRSSSGAIVEVFAWRSENAAAAAHDHPAVAAIWEAMAKVCDYLPPARLPEAQRTFGHFDALER